MLVSEFFIPHFFSTVEDGVLILILLDVSLGAREEGPLRGLFFLS